MTTEKTTAQPRKSIPLSKKAAAAVRHMQHGHVFIVRRHKDGRAVYTLGSMGYAVPGFGRDVYEELLPVLKPKYHGVTLDVMDLKNNAKVIDGRLEFE